MDGLKVLLADMEVPSSRKEILDESNLRWLNRNLHINNSNHPRFVEAMIDIRDRLRHRRFENSNEVYTPMENYI